MKIKQFTNSKGVAVRNQFIIEEEGRGALGNFIKRTTFQSYDSIIAVVTVWDPKDCVGFKTNNPDIELDETYWNYSVTTSKYRNQFLHETTEETKKKIASGRYILTDLNKGK